MKRRIFLSSCLTALAATVLTGFLVSIIIYGNYYEELKAMVKTEAGYIIAGMKSDPLHYLEDVKWVSPTRLTWIDTDGSIIFDSTGKASLMENHADRPEIAEAFVKGEGEITRISETIGSQTYYYAKALLDGTVLRVSGMTNSLFRTVIGTLPYLLLIAGLILVLTIWISRVQTRRIVKPINEIDLDRPEQNEGYDELSPLLSKIEKQNNAIAENVRRLQEKQLEFTAITENMSEGVLVLNRRSNVLSYNRSAMRILGMEEMECQDKSIWKLNRSKEFQFAIQRAQEGKSSESSIAMNNRVYLLIANPVTSGQEIHGVVLLLLDITDKQQGEQMRREFSANVSHELKTPLTAISGYAEIMMNGLVKQEDITRFAEKIYTETKRLILLVEDIIKLSRLDERNIDLPFEEIELLSLAKEVCGRFLDTAKQSGIEIIVEGTQTKVKGIRQVLDEMLFNLCDNSIKYNAAGGFVRLIVEKKHGSPTLTVLDSGIGIPTADQERVFERFYRVDKSHSKETGGTGLGLSIVKHSALLHDAEIKLESTLGKGTKVIIKFPD